MDSLSRIGIFVTVARQQSFAGAARELGLTPSAVSKQVQNLEAELGSKLLTRTTRKVALTEEGALFFERASRALADLDEATEQLNELKTRPRGSLRISVPMALGVQYLKAPIAEFARRYPEVRMDVQFEDRLIDIVEENFDVVLRIAALADSSLVARSLAPCPLVVAGSPAYFRKYGKPRTPQELAQHNVLAYTRNKGAHEWRYKSPDGSEGVVALQSSFRSDFSDMMIEAALQGLGLIISPRPFIQQLLEDGKLLCVLPEYRTWPERRLWAVFPPNRYMSTRLRLFMDHMHAYCRNTFPQ
jgi:DNA-binding transcriptional LysR family regulator